jgi:hypothetical protein
VKDESLEFGLFEALYRHASISHIDADCESIMKILGHTVRHYELGALPVVWGHRGWGDLAEKFLKPHGMLREMHWCGGWFDRTCHLH